MHRTTWQEAGRATQPTSFGSGRFPSHGDEGADRAEMEVGNWVAVERWGDGMGQKGKRCVWIKQECCFPSTALSQHQRNPVPGELCLFVIVYIEVKQAAFLSPPRHTFTCWHFMQQANLN